MVQPSDWMTLRIFLAALDPGRVTKAAQRCGVATSPAAKRIQDLEADRRVQFRQRQTDKKRGRGSGLRRTAPKVHSLPDLSTTDAAR